MRPLSNSDGGYIIEATFANSSLKRGALPSHVMALLFPNLVVQLPRE